MKTKDFNISGHVVNIEDRCIRDKKLSIKNGKIVDIKDSANVDDVYILPGFIDSHVHIESSMLIPEEFSRIVQKHGTVAVMADPHEICNVCGIDGIDFFINNADYARLKFFFGLPSCVPATSFETNGYTLDSNLTAKMCDRTDIYFLSEVMNYPAVIGDDKEIHSKIEAFKKIGKKIDGHAPGLKGKELKKYVKSGIQTDHESSTYKEAENKILAGMDIMIREGSAAQNFEELYPLIDKYPGRVMFCTDDIHPDDIVNGHINRMVIKAVSKNLDLFNILLAACVNPVRHYAVDVGLLRLNDPADFIVVEDLKKFNIIETCINGNLGSENIKKKKPVKCINNFSRKAIVNSQIQIPWKEGKIKIIEAKNKSLYTYCNTDFPKHQNGKIISDSGRDILKIVVASRYDNTNPAIAFVKNFGLKNAAIASTIAHDSHNIIAVGSDDDNLLNAINSVINQKGGISFCSGNIVEILPLPIAGIISDANARIVAEKYKLLNKLASEAGSDLDAPFMTLSFMALLVIPELKLSDKGLFDVTNFKLTSLFLK